MPCEIVPWGDGAMIMCGRGLKMAPKCWVRHCKLSSTKECDWPIAEGKTCDRAICNGHADEVGPNKHYCPAHSIENAKKNLKTGN
jgi:hypothetical protein